MQSNQNKGKRQDTLFIDPSTIELDAEWGPADTRWTQVIAWIVTRSRHQAAILGYAAILVALKLAQVRAADTMILSIAISSIAVVAIVSEWTGSKRYGYSGERAAAPQHAAQDQRITR